MVELKIIVENNEEADAIMEALNEAEQEGAIDFAFTLKREEKDNVR